MSKLLHQTCIAGLVKYLSPYTGRISDWMAFALSPFTHSKRITKRCSLWNDFNSNDAISQWRHRNKTHSSYSELNPLRNVYFGIFIVWKLTKWRRFVTYVWNDHRILFYFCAVVILCLFYLYLLIIAFSCYHYLWWNKTIYKLYAYIKRQHCISNRYV